MSHNRASDAIHRLLDFGFDLIPVRSPLRKLVDLFSFENAKKALTVGNYGCQLLRIARAHKVNLREFAQCSIVLEQILVLQGLDEVEVVVDVTVFCYLVSVTIDSKDWSVT